MIAFFAKLLNHQRLAGDLLLGIYNHLNNVSGLDFCLFNCCLVAKQLSAVKPSLWKHVDSLLSLWEKIMERLVKCLGKDKQKA